MDVWFIDDKAPNRATWLASFPLSVKDTCSLRTFSAVADLLAALEAGHRPDVVFVDFFLDGHHGVEVIDALRERVSPTPLIVAHSSMPRANRGMLRAGAHIAMEKVKGVSVTSSIRDAIKGPEDLRRLIRKARSSSAGPGRD